MTITLSPVLVLDSVLREVAAKQAAGRRLLTPEEVIDLILDIRQGYRHPHYESASA